ncbi:hydantoinase/oxoprolinase [Rhodofomes roseus]|uniref:Hydantoinase/oxoprolinase n=1 Tax=Rhodofomes roseus TaxID=34475 RepID=A0ABQ8KCF2_9APHY|nr:hydantoinase/oxoprolinase [Rhodofomes roseus]KAH9835241.1 hydantoinase/oxoprolinase [Rhodofomes roseus]
MLRIGVDVGGTNTDGVLIDVTRLHEPTRGVLAHFKAPTSPNVSDGIENAVRQVLTIASVAPEKVSCVSIGTTAFINAVLEADGRRLAKVAVVRISGPYTRQCPPFIDFPPRLRALTEGHVGYVDGGLEIDGREIRPLKEEQLIEQCRLIREKGLKNVVLCGVYTALDSEGKHEVQAAKIMQRELGPSANIVCSRDVGQVGFLERENATILNASILTFAQRTIRGFQAAMNALNLSCPLFLTQNDGTLTNAASAARLPIRTFASGPTNSMRGAAFLAGLDEHRAGAQRKSTIVADIGGTTTDVGILLPSGFPRQAASFIEVGGVRTNFAMADVQSIALGGGSLVKAHETSQGLHVSVGPESVGHYLTRDAKVFGGDILTTTDVVVASGRAEVGTKEAVSGLSTDIVDKAMANMKKMLEGIIDKMKTSPEDVTVLLVGGGSIVSPDHLEGVGEILRPPHYSVANAVGAAMAKVAGEIDTIELLQGRSIHDVIDNIKAQAIDKAIRAGADPATVKIVEVSNLPVQYVTNQATRIIVKAAGDLAPEAVASVGAIDNALEASNEDEYKEDDKAASADVDEEESIDIEKYKPTIRPDRSWVLSELDLEWIAEGCGVMGTGGGGSTYPPFLMARQKMREGKEILVVDPDDVPEDAYFLRCMFMGSPSVSSERLQGGTELPAAVRALTTYMGLKLDDDVYGVISDEIGGGNGLEPIIVAATMGKTVLDADLMGRAYPNLYQTLPGAYNVSGGLWPCAISDAIGNTVVLPSASSRTSVETILRTITTELGSSSGLTMPPLKRVTCQNFGVTHSVSQAWRLGRAVALCRKKNDLKGIPSKILEIQNGACVFIGKIVDVSREVRKGFTWGSIKIAPLMEDEEEEGIASASSAPVPYGPDDRLVIPFQNENLYACLEKADGSSKILVTVPDLITVLDSQNGAALGTPDYRYGLRVTVIAMAADPKWTTTSEGLTTGGPSAFGLNQVEFTPIAKYKPPHSVIAEFA